MLPDERVAETEALPGFRTDVGKQPLFHAWFLRGHGCYKNPSPLSKSPLYKATILTVSGKKLMKCSFYCVPAVSVVAFNPHHSRSPALCAFTVRKTGK